MNTVVEALRDIVGRFEFFNNNAWNYGLMLEYVCGVVVVLVVVSAVFKFLIKLFD